MTKDTGGQAFPVFLPKTCVVDGGMTLRDYFSAAALAGIVSDKKMMEVVQQAADKQKIEENKVLSYMCYSFADSMIEERNK